MMLVRGIVGRDKFCGSYRTTAGHAAVVAVSLWRFLYRLV